MTITGFSILLFGISGGEIFIIVLLILIFFGPKRIPEIARTLGKGINEIKKVQRDINTEINRYSDEIENPVKQVKEDIEGFSKGLNKAAEIHSDVDNTSSNKASISDEEAEPDKNDELPYPYNQINDEQDDPVEKEKDVDDDKEK